MVRSQRLKYALFLCVSVVVLAASSARAFWITCTSTHDPMTYIAYNVPYDVTTAGGRDTGDASNLIIQYSQLRLYSITLDHSTSELGEWTQKGTYGTSSHQWSVVNQQHNICVSWEARMSIIDVNQGGQLVDTPTSDPTVGPFHTE